MSDKTGAANDPDENRGKMRRGLKFVFEHANTGTNLMAAAANEQWGKVRALARMGACVYERNSWIIGKIGECGDEETLDLVIKKGASMSARVKNAPNIIRGQQALNMAARNNNAKVIPALIRHGADPNKDDYKAILLAAEAGHKEAMIALLDNGVDMAIGGHLAFKAAVENGHKDCVKAIAERVSRTTLKMWSVRQGSRKNAKRPAKPGVYKKAYG